MVHCPVDSDLSLRTKESLSDNVMPSGLAQFVKGQGQGNNADSPNENELVRRRNAAQHAKVQPANFYKQSPTQSQGAQNRRIVPPVPEYVQPPRNQVQNVGDLFAPSVLSDSDDTTRDLSASNIRGYQAMLSPQFSQNIGGRNRIEQHSQQVYTSKFMDDEEEHDFLRDEETSEDGHSRVINFPTDTTPMKSNLMEQALRLRDSQGFAEAERLHNSRIGSSHLPPIQPVISGRFTAATNVASNGQKHPNGPTRAAKAHYMSHPERNDDYVASDDLPSNESDDYMGQPNLQQNGQKTHGQLEHTSLTRDSIEHHSSNEEQSGDMFRASEIGSDYSAGSSEPSPSQHTPRANGHSYKPALTSSRTGKREKPIPELDYDTDLLSTMKYSELKDQPFDNNPKAPRSVIPEFLSGPESSLEDRLEHFKGLEYDDQYSFFAHMPLEKWEQSGDWFLERFGDIMAKLKDARRAKRDISRTFEAELSLREEAVRGKAEGIQEVFRQMRAGGEGVLNGRAP